MHVLLLDPQYWFDFAALGHTVSAVALTKYETDLGRILATLPAPPDCIIQQEHLGVRHFVTGLEHAPCPTFYLAFDAHLNLYWQQYYAKLFDAVLTPHLSLFEALPPENRHPQTFRLLPAGTDLPWVDHADRQHPLAFCGRITPTRPLRKAMTGLLQNRFGLAVRQDMPPEAMFRFYQNARVIPNEAICFEVNMRLFEGASAGAALLTPDCGPDQLAAFTDGVEMLIYRDGEDLCEKASWLLHNLDRAETMGRKARERVQREHLPARRAAFVLTILPGLSQARATGQDAAVLTWLTRLERTQSGDLQHPASGLLSASEALPDTPEVLAGMLRLLGSPARKAPALEFCRLLLNSGIASLSRNATASACALAHGDLPLAQAFHARQFPASHAPLASAALCRAWAEALRENGRTVRPGFAFRPEAGHIPACALEFLAFAKHLCPQERETLALEEAALLKPFPAYANYRLSLLESLPPAKQDMDELAALLLFCCRVDEGLALREKVAR